MLDRAAEALGPLVAEVVFVGGATIGVWITDPAAPEPRPTLDVDVVVEVASRGRFAAFEERLRRRAFYEDQDSGVICRWRHRASPLILDVMPSDPEILGFASRWYGTVVREPRNHDLPSGRSVSVVAPAMFLATKLEAFRGRGQSDFYGSRDFGDVVTLLDGRAETVDDVRRAPSGVREYCTAEFRDLLADRRFVDGVYGALRGDAASQGRAQTVVFPRARAIAEARPTV